MDPRHWSYGSGRPLAVMTTLSFSTAISCAPPPETSRSEQSPGTGVGIRHDAVPPPAVPAAAGPRFTLFESGQVRPLAISPDKQHLFAVNTPDNRLEIFHIKQAQLIHTASIPVGLEPVAVAARTDHEVWVVNHLSDSVSVIALDDDAASGHVERTVLVGDEPRDIVFAGPGRKSVV